MQIETFSGKKTSIKEIRKANECVRALLRIDTTYAGIDNVYINPLPYAVEANDRRKPVYRAYTCQTRRLV